MVTEATRTVHGEDCHVARDAYRVCSGGARKVTGLRGISRRFNGDSGAFPCDRPCPAAREDGTMVA